MAKTTSQRIEGIFRHVLHAPDGRVEGALVTVDGNDLQLVVAHDDEPAAWTIAAIKAGQRVVALATPQAPSPKGASEHAVLALDRLVSVDGSRPRRAKPAARAAAYQGKVTRFNYARHGAKNGVMLDTGDFLHLKPEGMQKAKLNIGDTVAADGDAWPLATGDGYVVEVSSINGKALERHPRH